MNWFCELKRWIRVYLCFLVPSLIAGILFFFQQWIAASIFVGIMIYFLLPLFIFSEEKFSEQRYNGILEVLQKNAMSDTPSPGKKHENKPLSPCQGGFDIQNKNSSLLTQGRNKSAALDRAAILIAQNNLDKIRNRLAEIKSISETCDDETKDILFIERDTLLSYLSESDIRL